MARRARKDAAFSLHAAFHTRISFLLFFLFLEKLQKSIIIREIRSKHFQNNFQNNLFLSIIINDDSFRNDEIFDRSETISNFVVILVACKNGDFFILLYYILYLFYFILLYIESSYSKG